MFGVVIGSPAYSFVTSLYSALYLGVIITAVVYVVKTVSTLTDLLNRLARSNERIAELLEAEKESRS